MKGALVGLLSLALGLSSAPEVLASCTSASGNLANYHNAKVTPQGSMPQLVKDGIESGWAQWNDCNENNWDFPWFSSSMGEVEVEVVYVDGFAEPAGPSTCATYLGLPDGSSATVTLYSQGRDAGGNPDSCIHNQAVVSDRVAHELGHFLGLANSPCTGNAIMSGPSSFTDTGRRILTSECSLVDDLNTNSQEEFQEECGGDQGCGNQGGGSPILIDLDGDGFHLTDADHGVWFDIDGDMEPERVAWTRADSLDAFLCRDRNGNGFIDGGRELFGDATLRILGGSRAEHGYAALEELDSPILGGNQNGLLDPDDALFSQLLLWLDLDHDGISHPGELYRLGDLGLALLDLRYLESPASDVHGNEFRYVSRALLEVAGRPVRRATTDVFFVYEK